MLTGYIDVTIPINSRIPKWPGGYGVHISLLSDKSKGEFSTSSRLDFDLHSGTHIDAPLHHVVDGKNTDDIPLNVLCGTCLIINCKGKEVITKKDLLKFDLFEHKRLLIKTDNSDLWKEPYHEFFRDYCALSVDAAQYIADLSLELIGIDYLSIQKYHDSAKTHEVLLKNEIVILETLNLSNVESGLHNLICLPMKVQNAEAAPCRVLVKPIAST